MPGRQVVNNGRDRGCSSVLPGLCLCCRCIGWLLPQQRRHPAPHPAADGQAGQRHFRPGVTYFGSGCVYVYTACFSLPADVNWTPGDKHTLHSSALIPRGNNAILSYLYYSSFLHLVSHSFDTILFLLYFRYQPF